MPTLLRGVIACALLICCAAPLRAVVVSYTASDIANSIDPRPNSNAMAATYDAAAGTFGPVNVINFESAPVGAFSSLVVSPGVTMTGADISNNNQFILNSSIGFPADGYWGYNTTAGGVNFVQNSAGTITFTFSTPVQSFGAYISGTQLEFNAMSFTDSNGAQTIAVPNPSAAFGGITFVGFTDAGESISSVTLSSIGDILGVDDVRFVGNVPEPGTAVLVAILLAPLFVSRRSALWS